MSDIRRLWDAQNQSWMVPFFLVPGDGVADLNVLAAVTNNPAMAAVTSATGTTYISDVLDMTFSPPGLTLSEMMAGSWFHSVNRDIRTPLPGSRTLPRIVQDFTQSVILALDNGPAQSMEDNLVNRFQRSRNWQCLPEALDAVVQAFLQLKFQNIVLPVRLTGADPEVIAGQGMMERIFRHPRILIAYCE